MNNKLVSVVLVAGIAATGFAGLSSASESASGSIFGNKTEIQELFKKVESGETLTADEQATLDSAKAMRGEKGERGEKGAKFGGKRMGGGNLTDEEKTAVEAMSDEDKQAFFEAKKTEMTAQKEAGKAVIDKLINGESLTAAEEATRGEMLIKMEDTDSKHKGKGAGSEIIVKILAGDELTADEETQIAEMQAKHAEREAQMAILESIKAKLDAGETLSDDEQAILDEAKANAPEGKGGKKGQRGEGQRGNHDHMEDDIETDEDM